MWPFSQNQGKKSGLLVKISSRCLCSSKSLHSTNIITITITISILFHQKITTDLKKDSNHFGRIFTNKYRLTNEYRDNNEIDRMKKKKIDKT